VKIQFEGRDWDLDLEAITLKQGIAMHLAYGFTLNGWLEAVGDSDPRALQCLYWLMLQQDGQIKPIKDVDCKVVALGAAFGEATDAAEAEQPAEDEAEADPTRMTSLTSSPPGPGSPAPVSPRATTRQHADASEVVSAATG
jgi:hypothetical protein